MSAVVAAPYAIQILRNHYPLQSAEAWFAYSSELTAVAASLRAQLPTQGDLAESVASMSGEFIQSAQKVVSHRTDTLADSIHVYEMAAREAEAVAYRISATKDDLDGIVKDALNAINRATDEANKAKDQARSRPLTAGPEIAAIETQLRADIETIITAAQGQVDAADAEAAGNTLASSLAPLQEWKPSAKESNGSGAATPLSTGTGAGASSAPLSPGAGSSAQPTDYTTMKDGADNTTDRASDALRPSNNGKTEQTMKSDEARNSAKIEPAAATTPNSGADKSPAHSSPPMSSGGSPASSGGSPSSVIGQMMRPPMSSSSASSSPASSSGSGLSSGGSAASNPAAANTGSPAGAGAPGGAGAAQGVRGTGLASVGPGIAESSARMGSGAVNATANALGAAGNVGSQVAQSATAAATQAATPAAAAAPPAGVSAPGSGAPIGGAPVGTMPAAAGGPVVVNPVTGVPAVGGGPVTTPPAGATPVSSVGGATPPAPSGASLAPVPVQTSSPGVRGVGVDGATGDVLFTQAMDAARDVITALLVQTKGYMAIDYAVSVMWERSGQVSAWLATSEGASYIPLGVRVPQDVGLAITDPVVGRQLWDAAAAAGGANPLEVVVRQAEAREQAAPGARVLAIASSLPMDRVMDWAGEVGARPVSVNASTVAKDVELPPTRHRCQVAMPWEWRQANAFTGQDRLQVAARHMLMAASAGHLSGRACEKVMDLFERRQPIDDALWPEVQKERFMALIEYQSAMSNAGRGGAGDPARALATVRAAEVVECLRNHATAEGCADLLYAARLAGAPLNPAAAVA